MIDLSKKSTYQYFGAGLAGFAAILVVGSLTGLRHGSAGPAKVAFSARPAAAASASPMRAAPSAAAASVAGAATASPLPVLSAEAARADSAAPSAAGAQAAAGPSAPAASAPNLAAAGRVDMSGSASSSASASAAVAAAKAQPAAERKPLLPAKLDLSKNAPAALASVHYGVSGRSELMGRAAGPVYNFSGGGAKQGGQVAADNASASGALQQVDAAEKQIDSTDMSSDQKAQLHQQLDQVRSAAAPSAP